jgi:hypothetical protein
MSESEPVDDKGERATVAGCLLMFVCVAVIAGVALYVATWRDADSKLPIPRKVAILAPLLAGALCFGIGSAILRFFGLPVLVKPEKDPFDDTETSRTHNR